MKKNIKLVLLLLCLFSFQSKASVVYVDSSNTSGFQNGASWEYAYNSIQFAINAANSGDSVWVSKGTYKPAAGTTFVMKEGVKIFGGFLNTDSSFGQRDWQNNSTILQGNNNRVIVNDGGAFLTPASAIDGFTIKSGNALSGGGMFNVSSSPQIRNCTFSGNQATGSGINPGLGAGIYNNQSSPQIVNCRFTSNTATLNGEGGAIYNINGSAPIISGCQFTNNIASFGKGGAIYNSNASPVITNCVFSGNQGWGGAIYNRSSSAPVISYCTFTGNIAIESTPGGAIYSTLSSSVITHCTFTGNITNPSSTGEGGAIYNTLSSGNSAIISYCSFSGNKAFNGGAIYTYSGNSTSIIDCTFEGNKAATSGGAIYKQSPANITRCIFRSDTALLGGAIYSSTSSGNVSNCLLSANIAKRGAGIYYQNSSDSIVNSVFSRNMADSFGAAVYHNQSTPFFINNTMVQNKALLGGSGLYNANNSAPTVINSILWGNYSGISNDGSSAITATYSLIQGFPANANSHNIAGSTNPQFVDTNLYNYRLQAGSPCIDAGNNSANLTQRDLDSNARIAGASIDLGAFEYGSIPLPIDLLSFEGSLLNNDVVSLRWQTVSSEPLNFDLQKSRDGKQFSTIHQVSSLAGSKNEYTFLDEHSFPANYYRLMMHDDDGKLAYSRVVFIKKNTVRSPSLVFPNPAGEEIEIKIQDMSLLNTKSTLMNAFGRSLKTVLINSTVQTVPIADLSPGIYTLIMENGEALKFIRR